VGKKKFFWFLKSVLASALFIGFWYLLAETLEFADRQVVWAIAVLSLGWALWGLISVNAWLSIAPLGVGVVSWFVFGAEAAIVLASLIYGVTHMRKFPIWGRTFWTYFAGVLPLPVFVWTISLGWQTALAATGIMLAAQLVLLYLPVHGDQLEPGATQAIP